MSWWGQTFLGIITHVTHTSTHVKVFGQQYPPFEISVRGEEGCYTASHTMCYAVTVMLYICACFHIFTKGFHQLHSHFFTIQWEYIKLNIIEVIVSKRRSTNLRSIDFNYTRFLNLFCHVHWSTKQTPDL